MQKLFQEEQNKEQRTSEDIEKLMEFSLFMAEMFYRVRVGDDKVILSCDIVSLSCDIHVIGDMGSRTSSDRVGVHTH